MTEPDHSTVSRDASPRAAWARGAGLGYLAIVVTGIYAEFFVRGGLVVRGDPAATAAAVAAAEGLFRSALAADLLMLVADVAVAGALYVVFRPVSRGLAILATAFRLTHAAVVGANLLNLHLALSLVGGAPWLTPVGDAARAALALLFLDAHAYGYAVGLVFFGVYCALLGALVLRSHDLPRTLGLLLFVAAAGYLVDSFARTLMTDYQAHADVLGAVVLLPAFVGEMAFALWLVAKGVSDDPGARPSKGGPSVRRAP